MTITSKPFYWVTCDGDGCQARCPEEDDDSVAYSDISDAEMVASESDWVKTERGDFCPDCQWSHCRDCGRKLTTAESDAGEHTCFTCAPELVEQNG